MSSSSPFGPEERIQPIELVASEGICAIASSLACTTGAST